MVQQNQEYTVATVSGIVDAFEDRGTNLSMTFSFYFETVLVVHVAKR